MERMIYADRPITFFHDSNSAWTFLSTVHILDRFEFQKESTISLYFYNFWPVFNLFHGIVNSLHEIDDSGQTTIAPTQKSPRTIVSGLFSTTIA